MLVGRSLHVHHPRSPTPSDSVRSTSPPQPGRPTSARRPTATRRPRTKSASFFFCSNLGGVRFLCWSGGLWRSPRTNTQVLRHVPEGPAGGQGQEAQVRAFRNQNKPLPAQSIASLYFLVQEGPAGGLEVDVLGIIWWFYLRGLLQICFICGFVTSLLVVLLD